MRRFALVSLAMIGGAGPLAIAPPHAAADSRPPLTTGIAFRPADPRSIYVRTTFGLLISHDDGCSFRWVCERAIGYTGDFDPKYAIAADGTIFATTFEGLRVSRDGGCTWVTATAERRAGAGSIATLWIDAIDLAPNGHVWVATAESAAPNNVYRSTDGGLTFAPRGLHSPTVWWKSVKVAPSDPRRVYVTGYQVAGTPMARLQRSDDAGGTWREQPLTSSPPMKLGSTPLVLVNAIAPTDPDTLLVTSLGANPPGGDVLYRSTDGGTSFTEVFASTDRIRDVIHAADGSVYVATLGGGSAHSRDGGATFTPLAGAPQLGCLGQRSDGALLGCAANWQPDFQAVTRAVGPGRWQPLLTFAALAGPVQCAAGTTTHDRCDPLWPA
ncbi:MAG: glycoside hydrolase, partial [Myxococcota bacterium]|nr:glycoside hydrolase [Myxococcota bacterium]